VSEIAIINPHRRRPEAPGGAAEPGERPRRRSRSPSIAAPAALVVATHPVRKRKHTNRRVSIQPRPALVTVANGVGAVARGIFAVARVLAKVLVLVGLMTLLIGGGKLAAEHVAASPRFALDEVTVSPSTRISYEEVLGLAKLEAGARLLAIDTDLIAARVAEHPWVAEARVRRQLPSGLHIEIVERRPAAVAVLGALYLIDDHGRPFKRATVEEADGLPVITGLERSQYVDYRGAIEAAYREALGVIASWRKLPAGQRSRPQLGEVNLSPRYGITLFLLEGGAEIRLGRGDYDRKLARLDQIFEAVKTSGAGVAAVRVVHLDSDNPQKIPVRLHLPSETLPPPATTSATTTAPASATDTE
jgi:cell division protein FtsQ